LATLNFPEKFGLAGMPFVSPADSAPGVQSCFSATVAGMLVVSDGPLSGGTFYINFNYYYFDCLVVMVTTKICVYHGAKVHYFDVWNRRGGLGVQERVDMHSSSEI
jgi:hypothetical protein